MADQRCKCGHSQDEHDDRRLCCSHHRSQNLFCLCEKFELEDAASDATLEWIMERGMPITIIGPNNCKWSLKETLEAYAAHVTKGLEAERDLYAILRGICEDVIDWRLEIQEESPALAELPSSKALYEKLKKMYAHPLDDKLLLRTDQIEAAEARNVELMGDIAKMERDIGLALTDYNDEKALREAAESRLAEAQKALQTCEREIIWLGLQAFPNRTQQEVIQHSPAIAEARAALPPGASE